MHVQERIDQLQFADLHVYIKDIHTERPTQLSARSRSALVLNSMFRSKRK